MTFCRNLQTIQKLIPTASGRPATGRRSRAADFLLARTLAARDSRRRPDQSRVFVSCGTRSRPRRPRLQPSCSHRCQQRLRHLPNCSTFRADDGTRTHDLLHGKRVVGSGDLRLARAWLRRFRQYAACEPVDENMAICGRCQRVWALAHALCPLNNSACDREKGFKSRARCGPVRDVRAAVSVSFARPPATCRRASVRR
jgi:hypothetical protein